jgi:bifunctional ADP-heptose synthase (sugar kinase/adenylyltransferase)
MEHNDLIIVCGDPIKDVYLKECIDSDGKVRTEEITICPGGALNVLENIASMIGVESLWYEPREIPQDLYTIIRPSLVGREIFLTKQSKKIKHYAEVNVDIDSAVKYFDKAFDRTGLVLADYNKGMLNNSNPTCEDVEHEFDFCVVDSKYRSVNTNLFKTCKVKIWHATNKEYCSEFAKNFDWVFHTNAEQPILLKKDNQVVATLEVPQTKIKNTCGAGDTFTASVASFLLRKVKEINKETLRQAAQFAIDCCQEVIKEPYTAITTAKL